MKNLNPNTEMLSNTIFKYYHVKFEVYGSEDSSQGLLSCDAV